MITRGVSRPTFSAFKGRLPASLTFSPHPPSSGRHRKACRRGPFPRRRGAASRVDSRFGLSEHILQPPRRRSSPLTHLSPFPRGEKRERSVVYPGEKKKKKKRPRHTPLPPLSRRDRNLLIRATTGLLSAGNSGALPISPPLPPRGGSPGNRAIILTPPAQKKIYRRETMSSSHLPSLVITSSARRRERDRRSCQNGADSRPASRGEVV